VTDTGQGVPPASVEHMFESFFSTKTGGTGLGLALVKQICQAHGGGARLEKTGPEGCTFVIWLPGKKPAHAAVT